MIKKIVESTRVVCLSASRLYTDRNMLRCMKPGLRYNGLPYLKSVRLALFYQVYGVSSVLHVDGLIKRIDRSQTVTMGSLKHLGEWYDR